MMRKTNEGQSPVGILLPSVLAGLLGTLLLMLLVRCSFTAAHWQKGQ